MNQRDLRDDYHDLITESPILAAEAIGRDLPHVEDPTSLDVWADVLDEADRVDADIRTLYQAFGRGQGQAHRGLSSAATSLFERLARDLEAMRDRLVELEVLAGHERAHALGEWYEWIERADSGGMVRRQLAAGLQEMGITEGFVLAGKTPASWITAAAGLSDTNPGAAILLWAAVRRWGEVSGPSLPPHPRPKNNS